MSAVFSLIPELEQVIANGSRQKCADVLQRITTLFLLGADTYNDAHIDLFDDVFGLLVENTERIARTELSIRLAPVTNAPVKLLRRLARDDDIAIAGPVLRLSPRLPEADLLDVANTKSRAHLLAIAARGELSEAVAAALARRGEVKSETEEARPRPVEQVGASVSARDYDAAQRVVLSLSSSGQLTEAVLASFCRDGQYEEAVATLATLAKVPIDVVDRVVGGDRPDPVLILGKAAGLAWPTVKAIFLIRPERKGTSSEDFDRAFANFSCLSAATAQRVVRFWQARQHT
jgi:uncharacterized protein (DUF2336 family)